MTLIVEAQSPPLQFDQDGIIRVGGTRVTLDVVVRAFNQGHTAEEIASHYPALKLADVYAVISYYLNNQTAVNHYLHQQKEAAAEIWHTIESAPDYRLFRERLLARHQAAAKQWPNEIRSRRELRQSHPAWFATSPARFGCHAGLGYGDSWRY
ncbi:MAG: hypothetical protein BroJett015_18020 [Chloroflexota bacterium]|nr:MAG: hypothetical protein BroJett015_18020 [Chloroflexota bacterium]